MSSKLFGQESLMKPVPLALARCWGPLWLFHSWGQDTEHQVPVKSNSLCTVLFPSSEWKLSTECILETTGGARAMHLGTGVLFGELCLQMPWLHLSTSFWSQVLVFIHASLPSLTSYFVLEIWSRGFVSDQTPSFLFLLENISDSTWHTSFLPT